MFLFRFRCLILYYLLCLYVCLSLIYFLAYKSTVMYMCYTAFFKIKTLLNTVFLWRYGFITTLYYRNIETLTVRSFQFELVFSNPTCNAGCSCKSTQKATDFEPQLTLTLQLLSSVYVQTRIHLVLLLGLMNKLMKHSFQRENISSQS